jgi:predicted AAA+ superfamily ATPase
VGDALQDFWLEKFLDDPNAVHRKAEVLPLARIGKETLKVYRRDLETFRRLLAVDWKSLAGRDLPSFRGLHGSQGALPSPSWEEDRCQVKKRILDPKVKTDGLVREIAAYFLKNGRGVFARHRVFRWRPGKGLEPVASPDPVRLSDLKGYDEARRGFLENLEGFLSGRKANNVLIYGERGTGKSSTVKAALNEYADRGLRLVELSPLDALEVSSVLVTLRARSERYLLFLDDLSFNEDDVRYRGLKALLEGSVECLPENVILVATSNRRHLMPETFAEREEGVRSGGEVHGQDAVEEKLSLADRFGLLVSFYSPDQETYLIIVRHLAARAGLRTPRAELESGALRWSLENCGRSGRTAAQYIRHLALQK